MNIKEVARRAGVSISTVSRVINNTANVNDETRKRVEAIINETGYIPNSLAKALQQNKTNTVGIILSTSDLSTSSLSHTIDAITDVMKDHKYNIMLSNSRFHVDEELASFNTFKEKRVDGVFYFAAQFTEEHYKTFKNYHIPIVMIGQTNDRLDFPHVVHDDYHGSESATKYLIDQGHKDIGYIGLPSFDEATSGDREKGYKKAMSDAGLSIHPQWITTGDFTLQSGYMAMKDILEKADVRPTAIFATTDIMAIGAMRCIHDHGLRVPDDISIIGFDDVPMAAYTTPSLSTVQSDSYAVGQKAAEILLTMIDSEEEPLVNSYVAKFKIMERESVKKLS